MLAQLSAETPLAFPALAPYQAHAWHAFLVQLAGLALHRAGQETPPGEAGAWRELLRGLTADYPDDEPWCLVVEDLHRPAFLQPPVPEGQLTSFTTWMTTADEVDVLVTSKNHDVKRARLTAAAPEHWVFALTSLQTMGGYSAAGSRAQYHTISRMNSNYGNRPSVGLVWLDRPAGQFLRDLTVLLDGRQQLLADCEFYRPGGGLALLWLEPWDGTASLEPRQLEPWYIEVCRRVRLVAEGERLVACTTGTQVARIAAKELKGVTGDPWTPIDRTGEKALTVSGNGFSYRLMQELLFSGNYRWSLMQERHPGDERHEVAVLARALARGQGETDGYHERLIPVRSGVRNFLFDPIEREVAAGIAAARVKVAGEAWSRALRPALFALFQGGGADLQWKHKESAAWSQPWGARFDAAVDDAFFPGLWEELAERAAGAAPGADLPPARRAWHDRLARLTRDLLQDAIGAAPVPLARRYQAIAAAEGLLGAGLRNVFGTEPSPTTPQEEETHGNAT